MRIDFKDNFEKIDDISKSLLLVDIALQFSNDHKFMESVLRVLRTQLVESRKCLSETTFIAGQLLKEVQSHGNTL